MFPPNGLGDRSAILDAYGKLPVTFEANQGQADETVKFLSRNAGYALFLTVDEAVVAVPGRNKLTVERAWLPQVLQSETAIPSVLRMKLHNANPGVKVTGVAALPGTTNYFIGNDPAKWQTHVPTHAKVKYEGIYPGIDMLYYGNQRQLEYDFIVAPGADPRRIQFDFRGMKRIRRAEHGDLVLEMGGAEIRWRKPVVYQEHFGSHQQIASEYIVTGGNQVRFEIAEYDRTRPLFIDPIVYSTYLGGSSDDAGVSIAIDREGNAYLTGWTYSIDFPTKEPFQSFSGVSEAFVTKINPSGSALVYSTYLGGSGGEVGRAIAVDPQGYAYVAGSTYSKDFPTVSALQPTYAGGFDAFVAKLDPTGSALVYSTYLGGREGDDAWAMAADSKGNAYVAGRTQSQDFPTKNPFQATYGGGTSDGFVAKINPSGSALVYSSFLGGSDFDMAEAIAVNNSGYAYVAGYTDSANFPTKNALQSYGGSGDAFIAKLNPAGSALSYSTYLGGSGAEDARGLAADCLGNVYVTGFTTSSDFPTKNPLQPAPGGNKYNQDAFVAKLNPTGTSFIYATYLGGSSTDVAYGIAADCNGNAYVIGETRSFNFPTASPFQRRKKTTSSDAFVTKINSAGSALYFSSFLGGTGDDTGYAIAVNAAGYVYVTGHTGSSDFPTAGSMQSYGGSGDAFVAKIHPSVSTTTSVVSSPNPSIYGQPVTLTGVVSPAAGAIPQGEVLTFVRFGTALVGSGLLDGNSTTVTTSALNAGTIPVKAIYGGDYDFAASTAKAVNQGVYKAQTTISLVSSNDRSVSGQPVTFMATVTPQFPSTVSGTVTFSEGLTRLKTVPLSASVAKFTTSVLAPGTHNITATYNTSSNFYSSFALLVQIVSP
jgi:hypothetical protein